MKLIFTNGATSKIVYLFIQDIRYGDGRGLTGLTYSTSGLSAYYWKPGATSATSITLVTATLGTYTSGGFVEVDATNMPGIYEFHVPAGCLTGASHCVIQFKGAANMPPVRFELETTTVDFFDGVRAGLTSLPNAVAGATGGLNIGQVTFKKNTAFSSFMFMMFDDTAGLPKTGLTVTAQRSIDGSAFSACANSVSEVGSGVYVINIAAADVNGGMIALKFTATGANQTTVVFPTVA